VGCCEDSKNRHAAAHYHETGHPIVQSQEPGLAWHWCYEDEMFVQAAPNQLPVDETAGTEKRAGEVQEGGRPDESAPIVRSFLILTGLYTLSASIIWGVNTLFLLDAGLSVFQVFLANSIFTGSMALFEIPTGALADTRGRRMSFLLSLAILVVGTLGYVIAAQMGGGLVLFGGMSVVLGLGYTFYSGAMEAWLVDALQGSGFQGKLDRVFARSAMVSGAAMLVGTTGGGLLGTLDLSLPFLVRAGLLVLVFVVAYRTMHDIGFTPRSLAQGSVVVEMRNIAQASIAYGWRVKPVRLLILGSVVQTSLLTWGFYAWQPYFLELLGRDAPWVAGVIAAMVSLAMMGGNALVEFFSRFCGKRTTLLLWAAAIQMVATVLVGLVGNFWLAVAFYLVSSLAFGIIGPVRQAFIHPLIPSEQRATVISFDSLLGNVGSVGAQISLGYLSQVRSFGAGYVTAGLVQGLLLPIFYVLRRRNEAEDVIVGEAGLRGACAVEGLPAVTAVESTVAAESGLEAA
jgi:MFS family permease